MTTTRIEPSVPKPLSDTGDIATAVVTGGHAFDVPAFHHLLRTLPHVDAYPQHMEDFVANYGNVRSRYEVILLFNWTMDTPTDDGFRWPKGTTQALQQLATTSQGIVVLHHALASFPQWPFWSELVGIPHQDRIFTLEQDLNLEMEARLHIEVVDAEHPITQGLHDWDMIGEAWGYFSGKPDADCHILLTTEHPKMPIGVMAWTHTFGNARVFCLQPGHDNHSWAHPHFRTLLSRGIQWAAGRLD
jgi:uncharacterized protein